MPPRVTITHGSTVSQICHNSSLLTFIDTEQIELKCNHPPCFGQMRIFEDQWPLSISNNSSCNFQALTSFRPSRLTGTKILLGHLTFVEACRDLQEGKRGHCDLFNILICLSSLSRPHYCPSSEANTWKHWPAGPQYWFIRWSPVVVKSLSQHTQDTINSDLRVCACGCVCECVCVHTNAFMYPFQSFRDNGVNKGTNRLVLGTLSQVVLPGNWTLGAAGGLVHPEVDEGLPHHRRTLKQQVLVCRLCLTVLWVNLTFTTAKQYN